MGLIRQGGIAYYDVSPLVSERTAVFPGDRVYRRWISQDTRQGDGLTLSSIETTLHVGAHADAPCHYHAEGGGIAERPLDRYLGRCQVIGVRAETGARIRTSHLAGASIQAPRVVLRTDSYPDPDRWRDDFNSLSPELIDQLVSQGVRLVGIDTPSIDPADDKALESHQAVFRHDLAILEGLVLEGVPDGLYTLVSLPLRLAEADASPVRAILVQGAIP